MDEKKRVSHTLYVTIAVLLISSVLGSYSIYSSLNQWLFYVIVTIALAIGMILCRKDVRRVTIKQMSVLLFFCSAVCMLLIFGSNYTDLTFIVLALLFVLFYIFISAYIKSNGIFHIFSTFEEVVFWLALVSLAGYLLCTILKIIPAIGYLSSESISWAGYDYKNWGIYFEGQYTGFFGRSIMRNIGVFVEGPVFACLLTEALFAEIFVCRKGRGRKLIFFVTMLTTFSTTALSIGLILIFLDFYNRRLKHKKLIIIAPIVAIMVLIIAFLIIYDKLFTGNVSGSIRLDDIYACFKSWMHSPIIGNGFMNVRALDPYRSDWRGIAAGNSCGIGAVLSDGGIILGSWYCIPAFYATYKFCRNKNEEIRKYYAWIILVFVIIFIMIIHYTIIGMMLMAINWIIVTLPPNVLLGGKKSQNGSVQMLKKPI